MQDGKIVKKKIFRTLTERFNYSVHYQESKDIDNLLVDELRGSLLVLEQKFRKGRVEDQALKVIRDDMSGAKEEDRFR